MLCSSSEDSEEDVVVYEDDVLVRVSIFWSSFTCDCVLKAKVGKRLLSKFNKKALMNIIIYLLQGNSHRTTQAGIHSSVVCF